MRQAALLKLLPERLFPLPENSFSQEIVADVPSMELFGYNTDLRSMTGGAGDFSYEFKNISSYSYPFSKK